MELKRKKDEMKSERSCIMHCIHGVQSSWESVEVVWVFLDEIQSIASHCIALYC
jgi:hypothetical protein